jgi:hypothetical protein
VTAALEALRPVPAPDASFAVIHGSSLVSTLFACLVVGIIESV